MHPSQGDEADPDATTASPRRPWGVGWLALAGVAWMVYELTQSPALGAVLLCLKFGWRDFRTACWLLRRDPDRVRRRATFWLYCGSGLWKTALVAFLLSVGFALVSPRNGAPAAFGQALLAFLGTFLTTLVALGLSAVLTLLAVALAWCGGTRLWLSGAVHQARRHDFWPPTPFCLTRRNRMGTLVLTSLAVLILLAVMVLLILAERFRAGPMLAFVLTLTAPVALVAGREAVGNAVRADTPEECWPEPW